MPFTGPPLNPNIEEQRPYTREGNYSQMGKSYTYITCPFCNDTVKAYIWSLAGSGKKCTCGVLHGSYGWSMKKKPKVKATKGLNAGTVLP